MTGSSIFDYTHQQDHAELAEQLGMYLNSVDSVESWLSSLESVAHHMCYCLSQVCEAHTRGSALLRLSERQMEWQTNKSDLFTRMKP